VDAKLATMADDRPGQVAARGTRYRTREDVVIEREALESVIDERVIPPPLPEALRDARPRPPEVPDADLVVGALLGCALGDVLGRPNESKSGHGRIRIEQFDPRRAGITDDTQLTIEIARNLVANAGAFDPVGFGKQLVAWLPRAVGIGQATREAVWRLCEDEPWHTAGTRSAGNGAAMRVAPIGLVHAGDLDRLRLEAAVSAVPTHHDPTADPASFDPAQFFQDIGAVLADLGDPGVEPRQPGTEGPATVRSVIANAAGRLDMAPTDYFAAHWSGALVTESLPAALWCLARSPDDPLEAIRPAAELARDADTVAAMAGSLAGALNGRSGLPDEWVAVLPDELVDELESLGGSLAALARVWGEDAPGAC
jgi:poly(ADP-ribose) glycohydrolase ARH3